MAAADHGWDTLDDARLIPLIQAGEPTAFAALYEVAFPVLLRFAYQILASRDAAEDAVQGVFCAIWMNRTQWRPGGSVRAYLYRAVRNSALDLLRHTTVAVRAERTADPQAPYAMGGEPQATEAAAEVSDEARLLAAAIRTLPERQRAAVLLRWYDDMPVATVAEVMGISRQAVEKLLRTAEGRLHALLAAGRG